MHEPDWPTTPRARAASDSLTDWLMFTRRHWPVMVSRACTVDLSSRALVSLSTVVSTLVFMTPSSLFYWARTQVLFYPSSLVGLLLLSLVWLRIQLIPSEGA